MNRDNPKTGILLVNLGTPDEPTAPAIRRYLNEFLSDPRVVDFPRWFWLPILRGIILRVRPPKLVENYELVWGRHDGPIRTITAALAKRVEKKLREMHNAEILVRSAMTYGNPTLKSQLEALRTEGAEQVIVLPMFPQYAGATGGAVWDVLMKAVGKTPPPDIRFIPHYPTYQPYIDALAASMAPYRDYIESGARVVFSFHSIPVSQVKRGDPYREECFATAEAAAKAAGLREDQWQLTFQSKFGPTPWLEPFTADEMAAFPARGHKKVLVVCPGFATDCLETIEEIRVQNQEIFMEHGGEEFRYCQALNARQIHADAIASLLSEHMTAGTGDIPAAIEKSLEKTSSLSVVREMSA